MLLWSVFPQISMFARAFADSRHRKRQTTSKVHVLKINLILQKKKTVNNFLCSCWIIKITSTEISHIMALCMKMLGFFCLAAQFV